MSNDWSINFNHEPTRQWQSQMIITTVTCHLVDCRKLYADLWRPATGAWEYTTPAQPLGSGGNHTHTHSDWHPHHGDDPRRRRRYAVTTPHWQQLVFTEYFPN